MKRRLVLMISMLLATLLPLAAQGSDDIIAVSLISSVDKLQPGVSHRLALEIRIKPPYHINATELTEEYLIPTSVSLSGPEGVVFGELDFPPTVTRSLSFSEAPLEVYEGTFRVFTTLTLPQTFKEKEVAITGRIEYQACDNEACLPPAELEFRRAFPAAGEGEKSAAINEEIFAGVQESEKPTKPPRKEPAETPAEGTFTAVVEERGLLLTFLLIFLGGLALNLTPCVYPMIPITIGYFGGQAHGKKGGVVVHALLYLAGMAVTYSALGVLAALTGSLFGGALQNPFVLVAVAAVMLVLALSMFNLFEFRLPSFLTKSAGGGQRGYFGTVLMGLTVGIVAAPCIGPFVLGLLTYVGARGQALLGLAMFFVLALGLGTPFVILAIFSGSLNRLPRSGAWMVWVRTIFGFVLLAMAVYFLRPLFPQTLAYHLTLSLILLVGGIYMAWLEPTRIAGKVFPLVRQVAGVLFFAAALILASRGIQDYVGQAVAEASSSAAAATSGQSIRWAPYSDDKVAQAAAESRPALIDFTADWCLPCRELDRLTFSQPEVVEMSRRFLMLKVDLTSSGNLEANRLRKTYEVKGVPTLVFLNPDASEARDLRLVGFVKKEKLLERMGKFTPVSPSPR